MLIFKQDGPTKTYAQITQKKKEEREAKAAAAAAAAAAEKASSTAALTSSSSNPALPANASVTNVDQPAADSDNTKKIVKETAVKHNQHFGKYQPLQNRPQIDLNWN